MPTKARGVEAVKEMFHAFHKAIPDSKTTINAMAVTGNTVMLFNTVNGIFKDTLIGILPTNKMIS